MHNFSPSHLNIVRSSLRQSTEHAATTFGTLIVKTIYIYMVHLKMFTNLINMSCVTKGVISRCIKHMYQFFLLLLWILLKSLIELVLMLVQMVKVILFNLYWF